jgi:hypothetical protein
MIPFVGQVDDLLLLALVIKRLMDSVSDESIGGILGLVISACWICWIG